MTTAEAIRLLEKFRAGGVGRDQVLRAFQTAPLADLGFAQVDTHRALRKGFPEIIFGQGKTPSQVVKIAAKLVEHAAERGHHLGSVLFAAANRHPAGGEPRLAVGADRVNERGPVTVAGTLSHRDEDAAVLLDVDLDVVSDQDAAGFEGLVPHHAPLAPIDDAAVKHLKQMGCLRILWLNGTKVTAAGIEELRGEKARYEEKLENLERQSGASLR